MKILLLFTVCLLIVEEDISLCGLTSAVRVWSVAKTMRDNALHTAARAGNLAQVRAQVGKFDINANGSCSETALWIAAANGHTEVVKLLLTLDPAPDVNIPDVRIPTNLPSDWYFYIILHFPSYPSRHLYISRVVDVPPPTSQHDIQYYPFLPSFFPILPTNIQYYIFLPFSLVSLLFGYTSTHTHPHTLPLTHPYTCTSLLQ